MTTNCPAPRFRVALLPALLAALVLAGCGGPAEIVPATPSATEIRESEQALEAAAAAERPPSPPAGR